MPFQTELEWAKEICRRQGYYVIPISRVKEMYAQTAVMDLEYSHLRHDTRFNEMIWHQLAAEVGAKLLHEDYGIKRERDLSPREDYSGGRHIFYLRFSVIAP